MNAAPGGPHAGPGNEELRQRLRARRRALGTERGAAAARSVSEHLATLAELRTGPGALATYVPTDGELDPNAGHHHWRRSGWQLHLPVIGEARAMAFVPWEPGADMAPNRHGIAEPVHRPEELRPASEMDVVLVPCVAADTAGNRLGFGAGYYDRALAGVRDEPGTLLVGIVYDHAVVASLDARPWDVPMDVVVTERRVLRAGG